MATHSSPDVEDCATPARSKVIVKIVGNMIELNRPTASAAQPATGPEAIATVRHNNDATAAATASRRGAAIRVSK